MAWTAICGALVAIGVPVGAGLAIWAATAHLWSDRFFLAGFIGACLLTALGIYVLLAEFFGGIGPIRFPLPPTRHERAQAAEASVNDSLIAWLDQQIQDLRGLRVRLDEVLTPFDPHKAEAVQDHFYEIVRDVDRRLHTSASGWVDYFNEDKARYPVNLRFPYADQYRRQLIPAVESAIDRIAHIRAEVCRKPLQIGGIKAGQSIHAGGDITAVAGIEAGRDIRADGNVRSGHEEQ
jgi:hypothetical protein